MKNYADEINRLRAEREEINKEICAVTQGLRAKRNRITRKINLLETSQKRAEKNALIPKKKRGRKRKETA